MIGDNDGIRLRRQEYSIHFCEKLWKPLPVLVDVGLFSALTAACYLNGQQFDKQLPLVFSWCDLQHIFNMGTMSSSPLGVKSPSQAAGRTDLFANGELVAANDQSLCRFDHSTRRLDLLLVLGEATPVLFLKVPLLTAVAPVLHLHGHEFADQLRSTDLWDRPKIVFNSRLLGCLQGTFETVASRIERPDKCR